MRLLDQEPLVLAAMVHPLSHPCSPPLMCLLTPRRALKPCARACQIPVCIICAREDIRFLEVLPVLVTGRRVVADHTHHNMVTSQMQTMPPRVTRLRGMMTKAMT